MWDKRKYTAYPEVFISGDQWLIRVYSYEGNNIVAQESGQSQNAKREAKNTVVKLMQKFKVEQ